MTRRRGPWWALVATAGPLYVTMIASSAAALVDTALLGHYATASLAAFSVTIAVFNPVMSMMQGAERGVLPFVAAHKDDPEALLPVVRNAMWLGYAVGALGALVVMGVLTFAAARIGTADAAVQIVCVSLSNVMYTAAVAVGQAVARTVAVAARDHEVAAVRRIVAVGAVLALGAAAFFGIVLVGLRHQVVSVFSSDHVVLAGVMALLPLLLASVATDALQAVSGFGLVGLRVTRPSLTWTLLWFGLLGVVAVPVAESGGLRALWSALVVANALQVVSKLASFRKHSALCAAAEPLPASATA
ncbi:MATE family efflux transporter [Streptantibioticus parmotrematis]|uniref:MATE family efflux transporter n=1 Tax=Streptantibioticus parmotrematis TaxID=2873249 RepID=UPI0033E69EBB